jgi:hypothetical protein
VWRTRGERGCGSTPGGRCHPTSGPGTGLRATDQRAPHVRGFQISGKLKNLFPHRKNRYKVRKNLRKIMEVGNKIWSNFCDYNSLRFFTDFEIFQRFYVKLDLTKLWSIKLIATAIANPPELNFGRGVLHDALHTLHYDIIGMHKLTPNIQEVIAFPIWLSVKQKCAETVVWNLCCIALLEPLEQILP